MQAGKTFWLRPGKLLAGVLLLLSGALAAENLRTPGAVTVHTVVPTECTMYFSWQSLGIFYSHKKARQTGPITRILSCTDEQRQTYKVTNCVQWFMASSAPCHQLCTALHVCPFMLTHQPAQNTHVALLKKLEK